MTFAQPNWVKRFSIFMHDQIPPGIQVRQSPPPRTVIWMTMILPKAGQRRLHRFVRRPENEAAKPRRDRVTAKPPKFARAHSRANARA